MQFKFDVTETRLVEVIYTVEADSLDEAREKAEIGDTIAEEPNAGIYGVSDREVNGEL